MKTKKLIINPDVGHLPEEWGQAHSNVAYTQLDFCCFWHWMTMSPHHPPPPPNEPYTWIVIGSSLPRGKSSVG